MEVLDTAVGNLRASLTVSVKSTLGDLWKDGSEAAIFIEERLNRLAFLLVQHATEADPQKRDQIEGDIRIVRTGVDLAEDAELLELSSAGMSLLRIALDALLSFGKQMLPVLLQMALAAVKR